jgi:hypothetical protein
VNGESPLARVRAAVAAGLSDWYGPQARLASLHGPESHAWSYQFAAVAETASGRKRLVVKVPRWEEAPTLDAALAAGPQESTRKEHAALRAMAAAVGAAADAGLAAVVPVAYLPEINAVVTERLEAAPLRARLRSWPGAERRQSEVLRRAGRALRLYHDRVAGAAPAHLDGAALAAEVEAAIGAGLTRRGTLLVVAEEARRRRGSGAIVGDSHGDFTLANVLVTAEGRAAVLDPNLVPGPLLADAAKLLTDLRMRRARSLTFGLLGRRGLQAAEAAFLEGYGPVDAGLLGLLRRVATVRRGGETATRLAGWPALVRRLAGAVLGRYVAAELARLGR